MTSIDTSKLTQRVSVVNLPKTPAQVAFTETPEWF